MGKAIFRSAEDVHKEGPDKDKSNIRIMKSRKNIKLNLIILIQLLNLALTLYLYRSLLGAFWK